MIALRRFRQQRKREDHEGVERRSVTVGLLELLNRRRVRRRPSSNSGTVNEEDEEAGEESSFCDSRDSGVRFQLDRTEYHEDHLRDLDSSDEWEQCWYSAAELKQFKMHQMQTTQHMFEDTFRLSPELAAKALEWQTILKQAFDACLGVSDLAMSDLEHLYRDAASADAYCLVGLESNMLTRLRGKAMRVRRTIMQELSSDEKMRSNSQEFTSQDENKATRAIHSITAPTSSFAHLIAVAQARALAQDNEE